MADKKITQLTNITGANLVDADEFVVVDISADETKAITLGELKEAFDSGSGFVRITGDTMTGDLELSGADVTFGDNDKAIFGAGSDLQIYHNGTHSFIDDAGAGDLKIRATNLKLNSYSGDNYLTATLGAAVSLYHNNSPKLATTSTGVDITGDVGATTATITGKTTTDELDLNAIAATISDTAVDIFVYDTRKDSDGGAWRKRTQATSWYNETLNTATRGSRKEFPAVAVIVAEITTITIYDGDDPNLPMWMVFNANGSTYSGLRYQGRGTNAITAINGILYTANGTTDGVYYADFLKDHTWRIHTSNWYGPVAKTLAGRNEAISTSDVPVQTRDGLVQFNANDVAATVLPNAPIDAATGLPVPTIAVATDGGVSVIKDDGTVVDLTYSISSNEAGKVWFPLDGGIAWTSRIELGGYVYIYRENKIPSADKSTQPDARYGNFHYTPVTSDLVFVGETSFDAVDGVVASNSGLTLLDENPTAPTQGMIAYTSSTYNTGWMNGDIKLATLSDTDDTDVTGSELVDQTASGWDLPTGWAHDGSGTLSYDGTGVRYTKPYDTFTVEAGKLYVLSFNLSAASPVASGLCSVWVNTSTSSPSSGTSYEASRINPDGTGLYTATFYADTNGGTVYFTVQNNLSDATQTFTIDDISIRLAEEDRSVNGNGLQVFGTVTKSAVASGADLVAYSGFSSSNYLQQPYNADLDFGTGDFAYSMWFKKPDATAGVLLHRSASESSNGNWLTSGAITQAEFNGTYLQMRVYTNGFGGGTALQLDDGPLINNTWTHFVFLRSGGKTQAYINGVLQGSIDDTNTATNTSAKLWVGNRPTFNNRPFNGSIALFRASATAPSPEQIKKIYEDEKVLFQENAQATLYGDSDAVTALAYDDTTELLHVGTSDGRSVFQGLKRVDNTTTAVGAAISASNGLVADE